MRIIFLNIVKYKLIKFEYFFKKSAIIRLCSLFIFLFIFQNNIFAQNANITISTGTETGVSWTGAGTDASPWVLVPTAQNVILSINTLKAKLANSNVTINTAYASGTTGPTIGTVTFSNELIDSSSSTTTKTLTISANSDIIINANIIMSTNYNTSNHTYLPKALNFSSTNGSISVNAIIKTIPSNLLVSNGLDITGKKGGDVILSTSGVSGSIKVSSIGKILTNGQYNANTSANSWGGDGGDISLLSAGASGGVSVWGQISSSAGGRANGGYKLSVPGHYKITTNNTALTSSASAGTIATITQNEGQASALTDSIGSFTKDGAGIYQVKRTVFAGTTNEPGYDKTSPQFNILNGIIKLAGTTNTHFSDFADFIIASTGTLELNGISETIGSISGAGKINTVSTPATAHTLTLTYNNPLKTQLIVNQNSLPIAGLIFSGIITGNLTLEKTYPDFGSVYSQKDEHGTLILTNTSNNYTGKTILRAGRLFVNANSLGVNSSTSDSVVVEKFGTLLLYGGVQLNKKISIKGNGEFGTGAILDSTGLNKIIGTIKLDSAATIGTISTNINLSTDSLELGAINTSTFELTIRNNLGVHAKGIISGTGASSLTKTGTQVLKLGAANDYTGFTKITSGSILLGAAERISSNSDLQLNGGDFNTNNFNESLRKIFILNSGSTITLGNGAVAHNLTFGFSDSAYVANYIKVVNWAGSFLNDGTTGTGGDIIFTKKQTNSQLDNFRFEKSGDPVLYKARQINNGANFEIVPGSNTLSNHANINIVTTTTSGASVSVGGTWTGSGTALSPHTFTLNAESAEIVISEIVSKLQSSDGNSNVLIKTDYTGSNQSGTIFLSGAISASNTFTSNQNTFTFTAKNTINLNGAITLTSSGYGAQAAAYPVTNLSFNADTAINVNANITSSATNMTNYAYKSANGGSVVFNLANIKGVFNLANTISIISAGSNNTHATASGGDGGNVSITANGGITINGNINLPNGASLASPTFLNTRPGTLTVATENATITSSGVNDGQNATSTFSIGNFIKNGTGFFKLNNAKWVGGNSATLKEFNTPNHQINAGRLQLSSNTSISDSASIAINTGAILDLASFGETLGNISGAGLITTSSGTPTLILTSNSVDNTTTTKFSKFEFSGKLSGAFAIQKNGNDTLILSGDNLSSVATPSHSGAFEVRGGVIIAKSTETLGTTSSITTLNGGTVVLDMQNSSIAEPFTFATGEGIANDGAIKLIETSTGNTISGAMVVNGSATTRINTYAPLTLSSGLTLNTSATLKLGGTGTITMSSIIAAGTGTLQQENPLLVLTGNSTSFNGSFNNPNANNTTLLQNGNGLGSSGTATIGSGALLKIDGTGFSIGKALSLNGTGISTSGVLWNTGSSNTVTGAVTLAGNSTINTDANTTLTMTTGAISGTNLGITKIGSGILSLGGTNTFTGNNTISNGTVVVTNINGLGGNTVGASGTTTIADGAMVKISVTGIVPEAFNITGTGVSSNGVIQNTVTGTTISGIITLAGNSTINTDASTTLTISGAIGGSGFGITKIGSGNLSLGGTNTFTGDNTISAGAAIVTNANGLGGSVVGSSGTTTVSNNAMVQFLTTGSMSVPEAFNITGSGVSSVGVLQNSVNGTNLTGAITLAGLSMIRADNGMGLTISNTSGGLDMGANELNIGGAGTITFSGKLTGSNSTTSIFRKDGTGTLTLSNDNGTSFTGPIIVNAGGGILVATHANALGTSAAGTTVFNQGSLQLGVTNIAEPINIRGHGYGQSSTVATIGALYASDNFTYSGLLTVDSTATLSSATATKVLTIDASGSIVMNDKVLNINGAGNLIINSTMTGSTTLNKWGIGTTTLSGDNGASYTGPIVVNAGSGILLANHVNALGSTGAGTTVYNQGSLQIAVTDIAEPINLRGHGYGQTSSVATIGALFASDSYTYKGVITMDSTATMASVTAAKMLTLDNTTSAIVSNNTAGGTGYTINGAGDVSITGKLTGIGSLTKSGTGTTTLSNDNSTATAYDAVTNVIDGILRITDGKALGTSSSTKHTVVSGTGSVQLENNITVLEPFTISSTNTNGAIRNQSGKNTLQGIITLNAAGTSKIVSAGIDNINDSLFIVTGGINTGTISSTYVGFETLKGMRITATISGSGGFTKSGADTLLLYNTNGNTFTGIATLSDGIVRINNKTALGDSASTITTNYTQINSGATLFIDFKDVVLKESFIINGIGEVISGDTLGPIRTREGRNYLSGTIKVNSNSFINTGIDFVKDINKDSLIFNLINTDSELTLKTNIGTRVIGGISGNGSIVKIGMDTLIYTGANTYKGYTKISEGCLLLGATNIMPNTNSGNELIFNGGTLSSGGKENNFGRLSITENSKINLRFIDVHKLTFATGGSYTSGKKVVIYGWSGLTGGVVTPAGKIESTNVLQLSVYLRSSGKTDKSKSGGVQASGQVVSTALGVDFNGRIYMNSSPQLTQFQRDRIRFYYDKNDIEYSATQAAGGELLAENPIAIEPSTAFVGSTLTTTTITSPTNTTAVSGGNITAALNDSVLVRGVVWSTSTNPTVDLLTKTIDGSGKGSFTSNLSGLTAGTTYYVRAYATNSNSTDYGTQVSFTTLRAPTVAATSAPSSFTYYTADMTGNISTDNGITITARGFVYAPASTTTSPTLSNTVVTVSGTTVGSYTGTVTGLTENTTYYVSSYATNSNGTTYGTPISFTSATAPLGSGVSSRTASTSAYAIKVAFPNSRDGFYWIQNPNINGNVPVQIYADMTTDGGGWTLIMKNSNVLGWNSTTALLLNNTSMPYTTKADVESTTTVNYSIINWADYIKRNNSSAPFFQYMFDANARGRFGGIFNANVNYSFVSSSNGNTSVALATKFGTWSYDDSSIEQRMPYYTSAAGGGLITTSASYNGSWWGTLISNLGFGPAPWIGNLGGTEGNMTDPGIIWYWVR